MSQLSKRVLVVCLGLAACSQELQSDAPSDVGLKSEALASPCNETVPANRNVDGIPAYAQCSAIETGAIFSNNGVDTSATSMGADWVKTQYSGGYQCTELAHRYLYFRWKVKWIPNGNAGNWCDTQPPASSGVVQTMTPVHGDIMVLAGGSCGAAQSTGHVNVVDTVDMASGRLVAVEQNRAGRNNYMLSCAKCFLHVMANDGTPMAIPTPAGTPTATAGAGAAAAGAPAVPPATTTPAGAAGRPAAPGVPPARAGSGAVPPARTPTATAAGAAAPVTAPPPSAAATPPAPVVMTAPAAITGAAGSAAVTPAQTPSAAARRTAPEEGCSTTGVGQRSVRPSLVIAGLWMFVMAAWNFRRRGKRELARAHARSVLTS